LPGDFIGDLPVNAFIHPAGLPIDTSTLEVLRRPVEFALDPMIRVMHKLSTLDITLPQRHLQGVQRQLGTHMPSQPPPDDELRFPR
jgi:hypothetical protein